MSPKRRTKSKSQLRLEKLRQGLRVEQALERVRTRTAKMKESGELHEIIQLIFHELTKLGIDIHVLQMFENQPGHKSFKMWLAVPGVEYIRETEFPYFDTPVLDFLVNNFRKRKKYISARFDQEDKNHFYRQLFEESNIDTPQERKDMLLAIPWMTLGVACSKNTVICILRYMGEELNPIEAKILKQFGTVFERSYSRIVELQQAEARARKVAITAAIERVRARTIAMRESDELLEVVNLIHAELTGLQIEMSALQIMKNEPAGKFEQMWIARPGKSYAGKFKFIRTKKFGLLFDQLVASGVDHGVIELKKRDKDSFYRTFFKRSEVPISASRQKQILAAPGVSMSTAIARHTRITIIRYNFEPLTEEEFEVLRIFVKAFDLSYLRFLELQQLEKQNYEREIEFSLERVRAASMAMQKSEDLNQVAAVVYDEMDRLNLDIFRSGIGLIDGEKKTVNVFITRSDQKGKAIINSGEEPLVGHPLLEGILKHWKEQKPFAYELSGKNLMKYYAFMNTMEFQMGFSKEALKSKNLTHYYHGEMFPAGGLYAFSEKKFDDSTRAILSRLAKVFHQAYTRFTDLQKAEAQTREAQIEAALERVRAASLAMHESSELRTVVKMTLEQLQDLELPIDGCQIQIIEEGSRDIHVWSATPEMTYPVRINIPHIDHPTINNFWDARDRGDSLTTFSVSKEETLRFYQHAYDHSELGSTIHPDRWHALKSIEHGHSTSWSIRKHTGLFVFNFQDHTYHTNENSVLGRFATAFEQAYTRFLDLQKAEAQAREAQIEAALERVRASSMAMNTSEQLQEVVWTIFSQIRDLAIVADGCFIQIDQPESKDLFVWLATPDRMFDQIIHVPYIRNVLFTRYWDARKDKTGILRDRLTKKQKDTFYAHIFKNTVSSKTSPARKKTILQAPGLERIFTIADFGGIMLFNFGKHEYDRGEGEILSRFSQTFDQAYTRFLDLQKAESQAQEARIEAALERIRAAAMAMHRTDELINVVRVLRHQMAAIGETELDSMVIHLYKDGSDTFEGWFGYRHRDNPEGEVQEGHCIVDWESTERCRLDQKMYYSEEQNYTISGDRKLLREWYKYLSRTVPQSIEYDAKGKMIVPDYLYYNYSKFSNGALVLITNEEATQHSKDLLRRAAKVFNLAYTRFLDLRKAEAQAREASIEAGLERVRATSLAVHKSEDLHKVISVMFHQLESLGLTLHSALIFEELRRKDALQIWVAANGQVYPEQTVLPITKNAFFTRFQAAQKKGETTYSQRLSKQQKDGFFRNYFENSNHLDVPEARKEFIYSCPGMDLSAYMAPETALHIMRYDGVAYTSDEHDVIARFGRVFEQAYIRFLDLQKAEAQTFEARIESALERVRNNAMAMDSSAEVSEVVSVIHQEMQQLGVPSASCYIYVVHESTIDLWLSVASQEGIKQTQLLVDWKSVSALAENHKRWSRGDKNAAYDFTGTEVVKWYEELSTFSKGHFRVPERVPPYQQNIEVFSRFGGVGILNFEKQEVDNLLPTLSRFGKSFEQVYTRFRDLQKAETQTREAQIEAALERVRSTALAMHHSSELIETVYAILQQITTLGLNIHAVHLYEFIDELRDYNIWASAPGQRYAMKLKCPPFKHPIFDRWQGAFDAGEDFFALQTNKKEKDRFFRHFFKNSEHDVPADRQQVIFGTPALTLAMTIQEHTGLAFIRYTPEPLSDADASIMKRLAIAFEQAYTRFQDLLKAEALAKERFRQASLDRVRAEIASMRTTEDLQRITPLLWKELEALEVPFFRCGVFIVDDSEQKVQVLLTTPEGKGQVTLNLPFGSSKLVDEALNHWRKRSRYAAEWNREQFVAWMMELTSKGLLDPNQEYFGMEQPPQHLALHFVPYTQGMLYIGNHELLSETDLELVQSLADAFSVAYSRFEDFQQIEKTLAELQATQDQLIQSEKMASLGELTAGIAHEIQNPLNFVNNFSEISNELIFEIQEEFDKKEQDRDKELVDEVLEDLKQNLTKIYHHGNRASSIVRGMLSHSRTSSGEKTLTDINQVIDEYLRLSYHGLRAKDKTFQAKFVADLQEDLPQIMVISQDVGRVMLNLFNNAFYTVHKKKVQSTPGKKFMPTVNVTTALSLREEQEYLEIQVQDNGQGMDEEVASKIFQPFFTTKPTGEGTGLGLSLSYDIITKGHGGTFEVESTPGIGTTFTIRLPIA